MWILVITQFFEKNVVGGVPVSMLDDALNMDVLKSRIPFFRAKSISHQICFKNFHMPICKKSFF